MHRVRSVYHFKFSLGDLHFYHFICPQGSLTSQLLPLFPPHRLICYPKKSLARSARARMINRGTSEYRTRCMPRLCESISRAHIESMVESLTLNGCATSVRIESGCVGAPPLLTALLSYTFNAVRCRLVSLTLYVPCTPSMLYLRLRLTLSEKIRKTT